MVAFKLEFYTTPTDLKYLVDAMDETPWTKRYHGLNAALCELIEDFSLVGFCTLAVEVGSMLLSIQPSLTQLWLGQEVNDGLAACHRQGWRTRIWCSGAR